MQTSNSAPPHKLHLAMGFIWDVMGEFSDQAA